MKIFLYYYVFTLMHELSHVIVALLLKVDVKEIYLLPVGVNAKYTDKISTFRELFISLAGPLASFLFAALIKDKMFSTMNLGIAIFNLLPIYPMDGGRILSDVLKTCFPYQSAQKITFCIAKILIIFLFFFSIISAAYFKNYYICILSFYIFYLTMDEIKREKYFGLFNYLQNEE